ncbi:translation initiation factor 4E [Aphelenchoides avenae]|nr:translation initiation factor 4E [Aphelenchus avenae]
MPSILSSFMQAFKIAQPESSTETQSAGGTHADGTNDSGGGEPTTAENKAISKSQRDADAKADAAEGAAESSSASDNSSRFGSSAEELAKNNHSPEAVKSAFTSSDESLKSTVSSVSQLLIDAKAKSSVSAEANTKSTGSCSTGQVNSVVSISEMLHRSLKKSVSAETHSSVSTANGKPSMPSSSGSSDSEKAKHSRASDNPGPILKKAAEILKKDKERQEQAAARSDSRTSTSEISNSPTSKGSKKVRKASSALKKKTTAAVATKTAARMKSLDAIKIPREAFGPHPLQYRWVLWYLKGDRNKDWEDCLKQVATFDTVEGFWALYTQLQLASGLNWSSDYYLFKDGIKPMWEDENNVKGGRWLVVVDKQKRAATLDQYWLDLLLAMIGGQFERHSDFICGAVVNVRQKGDKISLWTQDSLKDDVNLQIGLVIKKKLNIPDAEPIRYEVHKDASVRTGSMVKPRIVLPVREPTQLFVKA